ncbi:MAG: DNA polymerase III subunit delta' [Bacilli bacterium]
MALKDMKHQEKVTRLLLNQLSYDRVSHAYLFIGPKGVGTIEVAGEMAKAIFCLEPGPDACNTCNNCIRIDHGNHPDVHMIAPDGESIKIEQIRDLQKTFAYRGMESLKKVYIIDHAEKMTQQASNSLLKFLEDPYPGIVAILLTENQQSILPTIHSRCQHVMFHALSNEYITEHLVQQGFTKSLATLAASIAGGLEQSTILLDSEWFVQMRNIMIQLTEDIISRQVRVLLTLHEKVWRDDIVKNNPSTFLDMLLLWMKDILLIQVGRPGAVIYFDQLDKIQRQASQWDQRKMMKALDEILLTKRKMRFHANPQLAFEQMVLSMQGG